MAKTRAHRQGRPSHVYNTIERTGLRKGFNGNKPWLYVGTGLWAFRMMRRFGARRDEILISERIRPGERIVIANAVATVEGAPAPEPRGRRARKRVRKQAAKAERQQAKRQAKAQRSRRARKARKRAAKAEARAAKRSRATTEA